MSFSADSQWLAAGAEDRRIRLWSLTADDPSAASVTLTASTGAGVAFSPDGAFVSVSPTEHRISPFSSPDGTLFATSAADAELYHVRLDDLIARACKLAGRNLTAEEVASSLRSDAPLDAAVIRYVIPWRLSVRLFPKGDGVMVSPSGTRGAGSTKVRAGRR